MDGNIVSAGSFAAAVLETMGYVTQADFLEDFASFFRDAGSFVYFIGLVGALFSYVVYGSARAVRYLLIGPAIFWYLVGPTVEIQGAVSKLGGGQARGLLGKVGEEVAKADRNKTASKAGTEIGSIKVSAAFWLFVKPINDITEHLVGVFLNNESAGDQGDQLDRQMGDRVRGLELISKMIPSNPDMIQRLEDGLLKHCSKSYHAALGVAETYIKDRSRAGISTKSKQAPMSKYNEINATKLAEFNRIINDHEESLPTAETGFAKYIKVQQSKSQLAASQIVNGEAISRIPCHLAWDIFFEELWYEASTSIPDSLILTSGDWSNKDAVEKACKDLSQKLYDDAAGQECNLTPGIALATLWNHTSRGDTYGRVLARHSTYRDPMNPGSGQAAVATSSKGYRLAANAVGGTIGRLVQYGPAVVRHVLTEEVEAGDPNGVVRKVAEWAPLVQLYAINGIDHATYTSMPAYELTRVRQQLYTWAMQIPYYQGVLLYFLALAYPFVCLLVLIPGKAPNVLILPMAWMWVKSWDVGVAVVILLERVMYNILPNWALPKTLQEGPWTHDKLPTILGEGYNFSHVSGISQHYTVLAMALLAIPPITGAIFLKGKKAMLGNFTSAAENQARDAATRAAGMHSMATASERSQMMQKLRGVAFQMPRLQSGGLTGGLRGASQIRAAASRIMGTPEVFRAAFDAKHLKDPIAYGKALSEGLAKFGADSPVDFLKKSADNVGAEVAYESAMRESFDPIFGRWGALQMHNDAYSAALDGAGVSMEGGFETNNPRTNPIEGIIGMYQSRIADMVDARMAIAGLEGKAISDAAGFMDDKSSMGQVMAGIGAMGAFEALNIEALNKGLDEGLKAVAGKRQGGYEVATNLMYDNLIDTMGPVGYDKDAVRDRLFMVDRAAMQNPEVKAAYEDAKKAMEGTATGAILSAYYDRANGAAATPAGVGDFASQVREFGGNRVIIEGDGADRREVPSGRWENAAEALGAGGTNLSNFLLNLSIGPIGMSNPEATYRNNQIRAESELSMSHPEIHKKEFEERYKELSKVSSGMGMALPEVANGSPQAMAKAIVDWAKSSSTEASAIKDEQGRVRKQDLLRTDLSKIAETAPGLAIQEVTQWFSKRGQQATSTRAYDYQARDVKLNPEDI